MECDGFTADGWDELENREDTSGKDAVEVYADSDLGEERLFVPVAFTGEGRADAFAAHGAVEVEEFEAGDADG